MKTKISIYHRLAHIIAYRIKNTKKEYLFGIKSSFVCSKRLFLLLRKMLQYHMFKKICVRFNIIQFVNELAKLSSLIALGHPRNKDQYVSCATI